MAVRKWCMLLTFGKGQAQKKVYAGMNGVGQSELDALINTAHGRPLCSEFWEINRKEAVDCNLWSLSGSIPLCRSCPWQCCNWRHLAVDFEIVFTNDIAVDVNNGPHRVSDYFQNRHRTPERLHYILQPQPLVPPFNDATHSSSSLSLLLYTYIINKSLALKYASLTTGTDPGRRSTVYIMISLPSGFILSTTLLMIFFASVVGQS